MKASPLERFLRLFTDVRAGEGPTVLLLALNVFLILTAYYVLKPVREALILGQGSAELKSYMSAAQVVILVGAVRAYGRLSDRMPRSTLIERVTWFFVACLLVFYALGLSGVPLGVVYFVWLGIFNLMIVAQFWSFANDLYGEDEGERLFPIVGFGASAGAVLGAIVADVLIEPLGIYQLLLVAAALLAIELQLTRYLDERERRRKEADLPPVLSSANLSASTTFRRRELLEALRDYEAGRTRTEEERDRAREEGASEGAPGAGDARSEAGGRPRSLEETVRTLTEEGDNRGAFALVFRTRYLLLIGLLLLLANWVNTTGEYILGSVVEDAAAAAVAAGQASSLEAYIGGFYASFFGVVNVAGLLIQLFLVSRIVKYLGVEIALLVLPVIALGAYALLAFYPVLAFVRWAKTAENATDYSLQNTVRNMLFLPTTREEKYKGKQAIDSFFVRAGDVLSAVLVFVGTSVLALGAGGFAVVNGGLVLVWLVLAVAIGRRYRRKASERPAAPLPTELS